MCSLVGLRGSPSYTTPQGPTEEFSQLASSVAFDLGVSGDHRAAPDCRGQPRAGFSMRRRSMRQGAGGSQPPEDAT
jgi:hypothetical protein